LWDDYGWELYDPDSGEYVVLSEFVAFDYGGIFDDLFSDLDIEVVVEGDGEIDCNFM
jgi:hypothetical protein